MDSATIVLTLGHDSASDQAADAVHAIYDWFRRGYGVVVVTPGEDAARAARLRQRLERFGLPAQQLVVDRVRPAMPDPIARTARMALDRGEISILCDGRWGSGRCASQLAQALGASLAPVAAATCARMSPSRTMRIGLLGLGTVGYGVYREMLRRPDRFEITGVAVRRPAWHARHAPAAPLTADVGQVLAGCDALVELIGGIEPARRLVTAALRAGKPVVTANKLLLAQHGAELSDLRTWPGQLRYSAAVGGAVPLLERVRALAEEEPIVRLEGVLNGTCNFILDETASGATLAEALREAQRLGFAEADPTADIEGLDTAHKLQLLAQAAWGRWLPADAIATTGIAGLEPAFARAEAAAGRRVRLVGCVEKIGDEIRARVEPRSEPAAGVLGSLRREQNGAIVTTARRSIAMRGSGAGRWPTTLAVMADLFDSLPRIGRRAARRGEAS